MIGASGDQGVCPLASRGEVVQAVLCFCVGPVYTDGESALCDLGDQDLKPNVDSAPTLPLVSVHQSESLD